MVTGWSLRVGSSVVPAAFISCTIAFPREVTRSDTSVTAPFPMSAEGGTVVTEPTQEPARVFSLSKDFCAPDGVAAVVSAANAAVASRTTNTESAMSGFILSLLSVSESLFRGYGGSRFDQWLR